MRLKHTLLTLAWQASIGMALGACSPQHVATSSSPAPSGNDAQVIRDSIRTDPSVPRASDVLGAVEVRASGPPPETTAAGSGAMTATQESQQMPLPTQANDHSALKPGQK